MKYMDFWEQQQLPIGFYHKQKAGICGFESWWQLLLLSKASHPVKCIHFQFDCC
jgi:hypothetical protein